MGNLMRAVALALATASAAAVALVLAMAGGAGAQFACDPSVTLPAPLSSGLQLIPFDYCNWHTPVNNNTQVTHDALTASVPGALALTFDPIDAADDGYGFWIAPEGMTLVAVGCHCDLNCTTPATLSFADRAGNAIALTGGGDLTCGTGTGDTTLTTFLTSDGDRLLVAGEGLELSVTNTPTAAQRVTLLVTHTTP